MSKQRKRYDEEFKREAVRLVKEEGLTISQVTQDLGLGYGTLHTWVRASEDEFTPKNESTEQELKRLRKEIATLKMERDLLKKATAFFAKTS